MELKATATLKGEPDEQRTSVHVTVRVEELDGNTRFDLSVLGDIPSGLLGGTETGPNYHTSGELPGKLASPERGERLLSAVEEEIRTTLSLRLRGVAKSSDRPGHTELLLSFNGGEPGVLSTYDTAPPSGQVLKEALIMQIGTELRAFLASELQSALVAAPSVNPEPQRIKLNDQRALEMWKAGSLPLKRDQVVRLHERLGLAVPQV